MIVGETSVTRNCYLKTRRTPKSNCTILIPNALVNELLTAYSIKSSDIIFFDANSFGSAGNIDHESNKNHIFVCTTWILSRAS